MGDLRDDLVRRGDVMDELVKEYNRRWQEGGLKLAWIEKAVDSVRPVEDVRENDRSEWVRLEGRGVYCNACQQGWDFIQGVPEEVGRGRYKYCPFCGAKMDRSEE